MIVALDLGNKCGWAMHVRGLKTRCGLWELDEPESLFRELNANVPIARPIAVAYERICFHKQQWNALRYGERIGALYSWAHLVGAMVISVEPADIRKEAGVPTRIPSDQFDGVKYTRRRKAREMGKRMMVEAAKKRWPGLKIYTDDVADALWALEYTMRMYPSYA